MGELLKRGDLLKDRYTVKTVSYEGRFYHIYIAETAQGAKVQVTQFILSKMPRRKATMTEEEYLASVDLLKDIRDSHIPAVLDGFFHEGNACLVLEYREGINLERFLSMQASPFTVKEAFEKIGQLIDTLSYLYKRPSPLPFIHIDTIHIIISSNGQLFLNGFGLHLFLDHYLSSVDPDAFCAPEIMEGKPFAIPSAVYSLGALFYYFITKRKWNGSRKDNPLPLDVAENVPEALQQTLVKSLSKSPEQRFLDLTQFRRKLDEAINPPEKADNGIAPVKEEKLFEKDMKALRKKLSIAGYSILAVLTIIIVIFSIVHRSVPNKNALDAQSVYILERENRTISFLEFKSGNAVKKIPIQEDCLAMAISRDGKRLYLSMGNRSIQTVDAHKGTVLASCQLTQTPGKMVLSPDGTLAFVTVLDAPSLIMWSPDTGKVLKEIPAGSTQYSAVMSIDGSKLFVLNSTGEEVQVLQVRDGSKITSFQVSPLPREIAVEKTGNYLLISSQEGNVYIYDTQYYSRIKTVTIEKGTLHIVPSRDRNADNLIFLASEEGRNVYLFDYSSFLLSKKTTTQGIPKYLKAGPEGKILYVLCTDPDALILQNAINLKTISEFTKGFSRPDQLEIWP